MLLESLISLGTGVSLCFQRVQLKALLLRFCSILSLAHPTVYPEIQFPVAAVNHSFGLLGAPPLKLPLPFPKDSERLAHMPCGLKQPARLKVVSNF